MSKCKFNTDHRISENEMGFEDEIYCELIHDWKDATQCPCRGLEEEETDDMDAIKRVLNSQSEQLRDVKVILGGMLKVLDKTGLVTPEKIVEALKKVKEG